MTTHCASASRPALGPASAASRGLWLTVGTTVAAVLATLALVAG